jgi:hypothetical protein
MSLFKLFSIIDATNSRVDILCESVSSFVIEWNIKLINYLFLFINYCLILTQLTNFALTMKSKMND